MFCTKRILIPRRLTRSYASATYAPPLPKPPSSNFFSGRARYHDTLLALESSLKIGRQALSSANLYPLPPSFLPSLSKAASEIHGRTSWKSPKEFHQDYTGGSKLRTSQYRRMISILQEIKQLRTIASLSGRIDLYSKFNQFLSEFEKSNSQQEQGGRKPISIDEHGRSYALGKRKESSARVWLIPVQPHQELASAGIPASQIIVNNIPIASYFPQITDRERILRPLKLSGQVGAYNVFAIVRGGGTTGQSGALALGLAKCLAAHEPDLKHLLRKSNALRRDPRAVERKKTGRAKARKKYGWVKR